MALPKDDWLHLAKALPVGGQRRVRHGREHRMNMQVGNEGDRWWAYCQACKQGGVEKKEHVRVTGVKAPPLSDSLVLPSDMVPILTAEKAIQDGVLGFLAHKNMDAAYLPALLYSPSRKRIMLHTPGGWLGRDTTGGSMQKWLSFDRRLTYLGTNGSLLGCKWAVIVEDPFSYYKVKWALRHLSTYVAVYCSLGTAVHDELAVWLMPYERVMFMYDGDKAGWKGANVESKRFRAFGLDAVAKCAPDGKDPKDMTITEIQEHIV